MSGVPGMPLPSWSPDLKPCGTPAAYRRHLRRGEPVDEACRKASARSWQDRQAAGWQRAPRAGRYRQRVHLAGLGGAFLCGTVRRTSAATDVASEATCSNCLAVLRRHQADDRAREARAVQPDRWVAVLGCGHHAPTPPRGWPPRVGQHVSCPEAGCRRQAVVTAVDGPPAYAQDRLL